MLGSRARSLLVPVLVVVSGPSSSLAQETDAWLGGWTLQVGPAGDPEEPTSIWCRLDVRARRGRVLDVVPSRPGSVLRCVRAEVHDVGFVSLVLDRRIPELDLTERWELVGSVSLGPEPRWRGLATVTAVQEGGGRTWRTRFVAFRGEPSLSPPLAEVDGDPELGGGWTPSGPRVTRYDLNGGRGWAPVAPGPGEAALRSASTSPPSPGPAQPQAAQERPRPPSGSAATLLAALAATLIAVVWSSTRARRGDRSEVGTAPDQGTRGEEEALAAHEDLRAFRAGIGVAREARLSTNPRHVAFDSRRLLRGGGAVERTLALVEAFPEGTATREERTVPLTAAFPAPEAAQSGLRTVSVADAFPDEESTPVQRTIPLDQAFPAVSEQADPEA